MGDKEWSPETVLDVFGDPLARRILVMASEHPVSAGELSDTLDASAPTIYRRLNALSEHDLLRERREIDADGNHPKRFETTLDRVTFEIEDGGYTIDIQLRQGLVEGFEAFWSDLDGSAAGMGLDAGDQRTSTGDTNHG